MPSPVAALDLIKVALRHIGALATGEVPTADMANDGLRALNDVLEDWSLQGLMMFGSVASVFATVAGQSEYTIGPGGNWNGPLPIEIDDAYTTVSGVDYSIGTWTPSQYYAAPIKSQQQQIIERLAFINSFPLATVLLWPTPSDAYPITLNTPLELTQIASLATTINLPPGYARALQYAVAVELAPSYGVEAPEPQAKASMALIKRVNRTTPISSFDSTLTGGGYGAIPSRGY